MSEQNFHKREEEIKQRFNLENMQGWEQTPMDEFILAVAHELRIEIDTIENMQNC